MSNLESLVRKNITALKPYACARHEFQGEASAYLDANENPYNSPCNRYPDPLQVDLKTEIAKLKHVRPAQIMIGNGSDEPIDLTYRIFCEPRVDNVVAMNPTYGMYEVAAGINDVEYRKVLLNTDFSLDADRLLAAVDTHTKVIWLCSPNNPTGNLLNRDEIFKILTQFKGIVVIDEAYSDFSTGKSWLEELDNYPNLIVLHTFSKAWGLASMRCGLAFASEEIIAYFNKVKYPYNVSELTQMAVLEQLSGGDKFKNVWVKHILEEKEKLIEALKTVPVVKEIYPSDANFLLVKVTNATQIYNALVQKGIIVRNRTSLALCENCIRITVGTPTENADLLNALMHCGSM
ncbi:MAG: histidinol-phosphate transaminase [Candidatus Symbiothrix sp.]|jgi:histidinol-phosphate aminotransferase|nr:histidinol-phosphate transaminase [Candidatus Symbiothrix sp.]